MITIPRGFTAAYAPKRIRCSLCLAWQIKDSVVYMRTRQVYCKYCVDMFNRP